MRREFSPAPAFLIVDKVNQGVAIADLYIENTAPRNRRAQKFRANVRRRLKRGPY
jgi:hypothetical protein